MDDPVFRPMSELVGEMLKAAYSTKFFESEALKMKTIFSADFVRRPEWKTWIG